MLPDGVTVFDDWYPGVAQLDQDLLDVVREVATNATDDGITFHLNSGWCSPAYQDQLLRDAVWECHRRGGRARTSPGAPRGSTDAVASPSAILGPMASQFAPCAVIVRG